MFSLVSRKFLAMRNNTLYSVSKFVGEKMKWRYFFPVSLLPVYQLLVHQGNQTIRAHLWISFARKIYILSNINIQPFCGNDHFNKTDQSQDLTLRKPVFVGIKIIDFSTSGSSNSGSKTSGLSAMCIKWIEQCKLTCGLVLVQSGTVFSDTYGCPHVTLFGFPMR